MSTASARSIRQSRPPADRDGQSPSAAFWLMGLVVVAIIGLLIAWLAGWIRFSTDPRVAEIVALQDQARERFEQRASQPGVAMSLADATTAATSMMEIRQKTEALPEHLQEEVRRNSGNMFGSMFRARIDGYFALPPEQRLAELDRQINEEETWRKAFEAGRAVMNAVGGGGGQGQATTQTSTTNPPWASRTEDERNRWRKGMVDRTTPQERARYTEWRRARDARREQRGLPESWPR